MWIRLRPAVAGLRRDRGALRGALGEKYADYMRRTKRLVPWLY